MHDVQCYEVELDSKTYQDEVELLEDTEPFVRVTVPVDDGDLPASILPLTETFHSAKGRQGLRRYIGALADSLSFVKLFPIEFPPAGIAASKL